MKRWWEVIETSGRERSCEEGRGEEWKIWGKEEKRIGGGMSPLQGRERERLSFWLVVVTGTTSVDDVHIAMSSSFSSISATMNLS